jgi:hypothetical protein
MQPRNFAKSRRNDIKLNKSTFPLKDIIQFVSPLLILSGICKLWFYYSFFNINIIYFLKFGEIITSFFDFVIAFVFVMSMSLFIASQVIIFSPEYRHKNEWKFQIISSILGLLAARVLWNIGTNFLIVMLVFGMIFSVALLAYIKSSKKIERSAKPLVDIYIVGATVIVWIFAIWLSSYLDFYSVTKFKRYSSMQVIRKDKSVIPIDSCTYYIGNTSEFLFIYDEKNKVTQVEKMENIESLKFKQAK